MTKNIVRCIDCHVAFKEDGDYKLLALETSRDKKIYPNIWQCVTRKINANEKPDEAAIRELEEETGIKSETMYVIDEVSFYYEAAYDRMNIIPIFGVLASSKKIRLSDEHQSYRWIKYNEISNTFLWNKQKDGAVSFYNMLTEEKEKLNFCKVKY